MKDKEKQIEEITKDIVRSAGLGVYEKAKYLTDLGYRKIPENAVVLTREELKLQIQQAHNKGVRAGFDLTKFKENSIEQARKETAKEIATHIKSLLDDCKDVNIKMHYAGLLVWLQIAFGLEVEE